MTSQRGSLRDSTSSNGEETAQQGSVAHAEMEEREQSEGVQGFGD